MKIKHDILLTFFLTAFLFYSCADDYQPDPVEGTDKKKNEIQMRDLDISLAKELFQKRINKLALPEVNRSCSEGCTHDHHHGEGKEGHVHSAACNHKHEDPATKSATSLFPDLPDLEKTNLVPDWDNYRQWQDSTHRYIEIPLLNGEKLFALKKMIRGSQSTHTERSVVQTILVMKQKHGETQVMPTIVTLIGDKEYLRKKGKKVKELRHKPNDNEFTGFVYESLLNGKVRNAYYYSEGKKTHKMFYAKAMRGTELGENDFRMELSFFDMALNSVAYNSGWEYIYCSLCGNRYHEDSDCECSIYVDYCGSCYNPIEYCFCCSECNYAICICGEFCYICYSHPCVCAVYCPNCWHDPCTCPLACDECGMRECVCCTICSAHPCECEEQSFCTSCGYAPCRCNVNPPIDNRPDTEKIIEDFGNLNSNDIENLNYSINHLFTNSKTFEAVIKQLAQMGIKITFSIDYNKATVNGRYPTAQASYQKGTSNIYFRSSADIGYTSLNEELIHLTQYWQFYGDDMSTSVLNYEFEAKIFKYCLMEEVGMSMMMSFTDDEVEIVFTDWLGIVHNEINGNKKYSFTNDDIEKYFLFLRHWDSEYQDATPSDSVDPLMLLYYFK